MLGRTFFSRAVDLHVEDVCKEGLVPTAHLIEGAVIHHRLKYAAYVGEGGYLTTVTDVPAGLQGSAVVVSHSERQVYHPHPQVTYAPFGGESRHFASSEGSCSSVEF